MSNPPEPHISSASAAAKILAAVKDDERSISWLSRKSGIPHSTLHVQLVEKPSLLSVENLHRISQALGRPVVELAA